MILIEIEIILDDRHMYEFEQCVDCRIAVGMEQLNFIDKPLRMKAPYSVFI